MGTTQTALGSKYTHKTTTAQSPYVTKTPNLIFFNPTIFFAALSNVSIHMIVQYMHII